MITQPSAAELLDAVIRFIEERAAPQLKDRDVFLARVAVNALATVKREIELGGTAETAATGRLRALLGEDGDFQTLNTALCEALREGRLSLDTPGLAEHLRLSAIDQARIDQPGYSGLKAAVQSIR